MYLTGAFQPIKNKDLPVANCIPVAAAGNFTLAENKNDEPFYVVPLVYLICLLLFYSL